MWTWFSRAEDAAVREAVVAYCLAVYPLDMAKVMVSFPDELLARVDAEAARRGTTRSGLLQDAARREVGDLGLPKAEILERLDRLAAGWPAGRDPLAALKVDRQRLAADG